MPLEKLFTRVFKEGSTTYYYSSLFFPKKIKQDVFKLYAFVRTLDDFVDQVPADRESFARLYKETVDGLAGKSIEHPIIKSFIELAGRKHFKHNWIMSFLDTMKLDLTKSVYTNYAELEDYMYGSAEVIGLMMSRIMDLPPEAYEAAQKQGKAMQFINFIRDIEEDRVLNRTYIPLEDLKRFNVKDIPPQTPEDIENFVKLIDFELKRYEELQAEAETGYTYIPKRYLIPIKTAAQMYKWTAQKIKNDPMRIFDYKIKPHKYRVFWGLIKNLCTL